LWRHLGAQFDIEAPDLALLRTMYRRRRALFELQNLACSVLGFHDVTEAQRGALVRAINAELSRTSDRQRLLQFARRWLYDHKQIVPRERELRAYIAKAIRRHEATLVRQIVEARENGATVQSWLWAPPAKHSPRQIDQLLERIELLTSLKADQQDGVLTLAAATTITVTPATAATAPPNMSVQQFVDRNIAARGGLAAWQSVKTLTIVGDLDAGGKPNHALPFVLKEKRPRKSRLEIVFKETSVRLRVVT
jgi:hypothetical protein